MKKINLILLLALFCGMSSCDKDDDYTPTPATKNISKPTVQVTSHFANGTYDGWYVIGTVTTGNDDPNNVTCDLEWAKFSKKQSGTVNLTNKSKMKVTNSSKTKVQFKGEHAGINKGTYIYYRLVGRNSKYSSTTSTTYMVAQ